jgi:hypothetical protein
LFRHAISLKLTVFYDASVIGSVERLLLCSGCWPAICAAEKDMKIYLLMTLIGTLLTAIHFTSAPKQDSETLPR